MHGRRALRAGRALGLVVALAAAGAAEARADERVIAYEGASYRQADLAALGLGTAGSWFPQFGAGAPVSGRPTGENARDDLPEWVAPLNHWGSPTDVGCEASELLAGCLPTFFFRSFSQDGPARSAGGEPAWSELRLPGGELGGSGAIVDPHTGGGNRNNTINRIQLRGEVPDEFWVAVVTDNTSGHFDPLGALALRGNAGPLDLDPTQIEPSSTPRTCELVFDGVPDVHVFRVSGFRDGDYLKLRLAGGPDAGASFGGLLFDASFGPPVGFASTGSSTAC